MLVLSKHVEKEHQLEVSQQHLSFEKFDEFIKWKESEKENATHIMCRIQQQKHVAQPSTCTCIVIDSVQPIKR